MLQRVLFSRKAADGQLAIGLEFVLTFLSGGTGPWLLDSSFDRENSLRRTDGIPTSHGCQEGGTLGGGEATACNQGMRHFPALFAACEDRIAPVHVRGEKITAVYQHDNSRFVCEIVRTRLGIVKHASEGLSLILDHAPGRTRYIVAKL